MSEAAAAALPADLDALVREVMAQVPRLLALQDRDPDSPTRGCMHPAYWRDKSSDVADMRRQEAALAFAWTWRHDFPGSRWRGEREILHAALRALGFWTRQQHPDGTFDEWYRNEHGYATTAFSSYAVSLAVEALGEELRGELRDDVLRAVGRAGGWLATHDDWFKTNHEAVGVAALGAAGTLLGDQALLAAARRNAGLIASRMHPDGWSSEISGLDLGYSFLLAEYLVMHALVTGEEVALAPAAKAWRFAADFLHPELSTGAEYGICANPYFSRVGAVALARHEPLAAAALSWMESARPGLFDTSATLKDDLRLARYAYQPLLAALIASGRFPRRDAAPSAAGTPARLLFEEARTERWRPSAGLLAVARPGYAAWAAPAGGGIVRAVFRDGEGFRRAVVHRGYVLDDGRNRYRNARYRRDTEARFENGELSVAAPLLRCGFVMPPYWARVGLRVATSLPKGHRWSRWLIDQWRRRKGTALNQSTAGISGGRGPLRLERRVRFEDDALVIRDRLVATQGPVSPAQLFLVADGPVVTARGETADPDRRIPLAPYLGTGPRPELMLEQRFSAGPDGGAVLTIAAG